MDVSLFALVLVIVGVVFGIINSAFRSHDFWFWLALLFIVVLKTGGFHL